MNVSSKEVFIRLKNVQEIVSLLEEIKSSQDNLNEMFSKVDSLKSKEERILENWMSQLEDLDEKVEHLAL